MYALTFPTDDQQSLVLDSNHNTTGAEWDTLSRNC